MHSANCGFLQRGRISLLSLDHPEAHSPSCPSLGCSLRIRKWAERGHLGCLLYANHRLGAFIKWSAVHLPSTLLHSTSKEAEIREATGLAHVTGLHRGHQNPIPELRPKHQAQIWPRKSHPPSCKISSSLSSVQHPGFQRKEKRLEQQPLGSRNWLRSRSPDVFFFVSKHQITKQLATLCVAS